MPFDGTDDREERLARLEILREIAAKSRGSQDDFMTCLHADIRADGRLGLRRPQTPKEVDEQENTFGIARLFGVADIATKRELIAAEISRWMELTDAV